MRNMIFTLDLEDHTKSYSENGRYIVNTMRWLEFLESMDIRGTFFVVAKVAKVAPNLIKKIEKSGHEVGSHSLEHTELTQQNPDIFYRSEKEARDILEESIGNKIYGFRAPVFSLTKDTVWALDVLKELGYRYSSSVIPCDNPLNGFPGLPREPFAWNNGLIEFSCPIYSIGPFSMPFLGGIYLRYLPHYFINMIIKRATNEYLWTYMHPYDIDTEEGFIRLPDATLATSVLVWLKRKNTFKKLNKILTPGVNLRFIDLVENEKLFADIQVSNLQANND